MYDVYIVICKHIYVGSLCQSVSESGDVATRLLPGFLPTHGTGPLLDLCLGELFLFSDTLGNAPPTSAFIQILISPFSPGLYFCRSWGLP